MSERKKWQFLSGSSLKLLAVVSMLTDHLAAFLWFDNPAFQQVLFTARGRDITCLALMRIFGRLAFPIFAFLVAEGFLHTHDRRKYALNLLAFALISELPWNLVHGGGLLYASQNVMFTLLLGYLGIWAMEYFREDRLRMSLSVLGLFVVSFFLRADYGYLGYSFVLMLYLLRNQAAARAAVGCCMLPGRWIAGLAFLPIACYDGRRGFIRGAVAKYLFYAFYPAHLLVIALIRIL